MGLNTLEIARKSVSNNINDLELAMVNNFDQVDCPVVHRFTEGMYVRETTMPTGSLITSRIHKTQHTYFVMKGKAIVWIDGVEHLIEAPYIGITEPNTRRVLYIVEECTWATSHPNVDNENLEQIADRILEKNDNPLLSIEIKNRLDNLIKEKI
jgi:quercetin dioxygenase-like cupin family protein